MLKNVIVLVIIGLAGYYAYSFFYQDNGYESVDADLPPLTSE